MRWSKLHRELKHLASEIAALQPVQEEDD
jgi:hypothetical protein